MAGTLDVELAATNAVTLAVTTAYEPANGHRLLDLRGGPVHGCQRRPDAHYLRHSSAYERDPGCCGASAALVVAAYSDAGFSRNAADHARAGRSGNDARPMRRVSPPARSSV